MLRRAAAPRRGSCSGTGRRSPSCRRARSCWPSSPAYRHQAFRVGAGGLGRAGPPRGDRRHRRRVGPRGQPAAGRRGPRRPTDLVAEVRGAEAELAGTWRPLAEAFAAVVRAVPRRAGARPPLDSVTLVTLGRGSSASGRLARLGFTEPARPRAALESRRARPTLLDDEQVLLDLAARRLTPTPRCTPSAALLDAADDPATRARPCTRTSGCAPALLAVLGASPALAEHLARHPEHWRAARGRGPTSGPTAAGLRARLLRASAPTRRPRRSLPRRPARRAAGRLPRRPARPGRPRPRAAALDVADVAAELADLAAATLEAALAVARPSSGDGRADLPARRRRDGQVRRPRAQLRQRRRRRLRRRARRRRGRGRRRCKAAAAARRRDDAGLLGHHRRGHHLAGRRGAAPRGQGRAAGAHAGQPRRLLPALGQDLGVPGAAQGPAGRRRPRARPGLRRRARRRWCGRRPSGRTSSPTCSRCAAGSSRRCRPRTATASSSSGPGGLRDVEFAVQLLQLVHGRTDETLRSPNTLEALEALSTYGYVGPRRRRRAGPRLPVPAHRRAPAPAAPAAAHPRHARGRGRAAPARPLARPAHRPGRASWTASGAGTPARCAGCTRSCSTGRC